MQVVFIWAGVFLHFDLDHFSMTYQIDNLENISMFERKAIELFNVQVYFFVAFQNLFGDHAYMSRVLHEVSRYLIIFH